jgi:hypothetical protein
VTRRLTEIKRRGRLSLIIGAFMTAVACAAVALADEISNNDVVTGADSSLVRGASSKAHVFISAPITAPGDANGCNATGSSPAQAAVTLSAGGTSSDTEPLVGCGSSNFVDLDYSVESTAILGSLITVTSNVTGGKPGSTYRQDGFTVRVLPRPASGLAAGASGATEIDLSWTASPDATDITDYKIYDGPTEVASAANNATSTPITGLAAGSTHCYTIKARVSVSGTDYFSTASNGSCATTVSDSTAPVITKEITGTAGSGGWYRSDVTVAWTVTDPDSAVSIDSGCGTQSFTAETAGTTSSCQAHSAGGSASDSMTVMIDKTAPVTSASATKAGGAPYAAGTWTNLDVTVSFTCADGGAVSSGLAMNTVAGATLSAETENGSVTNSGACTDNAGNSADPEAFTPIMIDKTKPVISATATSGSSPYAAGDWTNQDVTVSFNCADGAGPANSGLAGNTVGGGGTESAETATGSFTSTGGCTDNAGNSADPETFSPIKIDKTAPLISATAKKADNSPYSADTWTNQSVTVSFTCADTAGPANSGIQTDTVAGDTLSGDTANGSVTNTGVCTDSAGNSADPKTFSPIKIDKTPPDLNISGAAAGTSYNVCGSLPTRPTFSPSDPLSGLDGSEGESWSTPGSSTGVGTYTYMAHAQDHAGNASAETRTYRLLYGAAIGDFLQPINMDGSSRFKLGSTIPVKFQALCGTTPVSGVVAKLNVKFGDLTPDPGAEEAISTSAATTGNLFRWTGAPDNQYIFNLSTKSGYSNPGGGTIAFTIGTWTLSALLDDGTYRSVIIQLPR